MADVDLTSLEEVRTYLQTPVGDTEQDTIIEALITRASTMIMRYTQREFAPAASAQARAFDYDGYGLLDLAPYDLREVATVQVDTDTASPTTLSEDQYRLLPVPSPDGVYTMMRLDVPGGATVWPTREITVTGDWGFDTVPYEIESACIETVAQWLRRDVATFESTFSLDEGRLEKPSRLPRAVAVGLDMWRRRGIG